MEDNKNEVKLAFEVWIGSDHCIVFATTPAKARWIAVKGYREAGYNSRGDWPNPVAKRAPRYDKSRLREEGQKCFAPDYVEDTI